MSIQAGIWNFDDEPASEKWIKQVSAATAQHGPDGEELFVNGSLGMLFRPFHTTKESCLERQPYVSSRNNVITWDGRLDNREELVLLLDEHLADDRTDVALVAAAFDKWETECFARLLGEWALVVWNPRERALIFAKDFMGTRHLYYRRTSKQLLWCTTLEPIVLLSNDRFQLNRDFLAGYLASYPAAHLTPYLGIDSIPPCSHVTIKNGSQTVQKYWKFNPRTKIRYRTDSEYEEHFQELFSEAVIRRLRSHTPIVAELSGGMDSSSIVCMADALIAAGRAETPRLDTVSYYDDEEPSCNERPYFQKVEQKRGRVGCHISAVPRDRFAPLPESYFSAIPGVTQSILHFENEQAACMRAQGNRVLLSGIGGDEVLGGVPTPIPELADLLRQFRFLQFASRLKAWSLARKRPWMHLALNASRVSLGRPLGMSDSSKLRRLTWLDKTFLKQVATSLQDKDVFRTTSCLPSQEAFVKVISHLCDQLGYTPQPLVATQEIRYPYLDRTLCEFLFSIPRDQILRPSQRRSLMRRSLAGIVPTEILQRKRKAFVVRRLMTMYEEAWPVFQGHFSNSLSQKFGYVHDELFLRSVEATKHGQVSNLVSLSRTIAMEIWLREMTRRKLIYHSAFAKESKSVPVCTPCVSLRRV